MKKNLTECNNKSNQFLRENLGFKTETTVKSSASSKKMKHLAYFKQIKEILSLRIALENIQIDNKTLETEIKTNIETINLDKYDIKIINDIVDNLIDIIKENQRLLQQKKKNELKFEKRRTNNNNNNKDKDIRRQTLDNFRSSYRTIADEVNDHIRNRTIEVRFDSYFIITFLIELFTKTER